MTMPAAPTKFTSFKSSVAIVLLCAAVAAGIFAIDVELLPLGVAAGVAYVGVVLIALCLPKWQHTFIIAIGVSVLTVAGFLLSDPGGVPWMVSVNRLLALAAIWLTAIGGTWLSLAKRKKSANDLQRIEQAAEQARNAKSRFLKTASNDMRHYLQTLSLLNGALRKTVSEGKAQEMLAKQGDAIAGLSDLLNSLREISEFESGEVELRIAKTQVQDVFQQLRVEFEHQAEAKGLQLVFDSGAEVVLSDGVLLKRIVRILVSNAIRYTDKGEVKVFCSRDSGELKITVQDSGVGIDADQKSKIFDEFYRIDNDPAGRNNGLGLGLSIVERSVTLLGARIEVESERGRGSRFSLVIARPDA